MAMTRIVAITNSEIGFGREDVLIMVRLGSRRSILG